MGIVMRYLSDKQKRIVIVAAICSAVVTSLYSSYYVLTVDQYAVRYGGPNGVADFSLVYGLLLFVLSLLSAVLFCKKKVGWQLFLICSFISVAVLIVSSLFTTALLLSLFGLALCLFINVYEKRGMNAAIIMGLVMFFLAFLVYIFSESISDWLFNNTEDLNWILRARIRSVTDKVLNTEHDLGGYNADRRGELAGYSLHTFMAHPLFGVGYTGFGYGVIGNHQEWQDVLGVFGLAGSTVLIAVLIAIICQVFRRNNNKADRISFSVVLLIFAVLGFLNPCFSPPVLTAVFVIAPNVSVFCSVKEERVVYDLQGYKYIRDYV